MHQFSINCSLLFGWIVHDFSIDFCIDFFIDFWSILAPKGRAKIVYFGVMSGSKVDFWCTPQMGEGTLEPPWSRQTEPETASFDFWSVLGRSGSILIDFGSILVRFLIAGADKRKPIQPTSVFYGFWTILVDLGLIFNRFGIDLGRFWLIFNWFLIDLLIDLRLICDRFLIDSWVIINIK